MLRAITQFDFIAGDAKPTGAKLEQPERGVNVTIDTLSLNITQELNASSSDFLHYSKELSKLAVELFKPLHVVRNGFAMKHYLPFPSAAEMVRASLGLLPTDRDEKLATAFAMSRKQTSLDRWYSEGKKDFHLVVQPSTFEKSGFERRNPGHGLTAMEKKRIQRQNRFGELVKESLGYALLMETDLMEDDPPVQSDLENQLAELTRLSEIAKQEFRPR